MECDKYNEALVTDSDLQEKVLARGQNHLRMVFKKMSKSVINTLRMYHFTPIS